MNFALSLFRRVSDKSAREASRTWQEFCARMTSPEVRADKDGPLFSPARFDPKTRANGNVVEFSMLGLDCDHGNTLEGDLPRWRKLGYAFAAYTTHSHSRITDSNKNGEERFRVMLPLALPMPAIYHPALWQWAFHISGEKLDTSAKDLARIFYWPAKFSVDAEYRHEIHEGPLLDWRELPAIKYVVKAFESEIAELLATTEKRNDQLFKSAAALGELVAGECLDDDRVIKALRDAAEKIGLDVDKNCGTKGIEATIQSGLRAGRKKPRRPDYDGKPKAKMPEEPPSFWPDGCDAEPTKKQDNSSAAPGDFGVGFYGSLAELHAKETMPADDLMIAVRRRQVTIFASVTDVGKTTIMLNHALAGAGGQSWMPLMPAAPERPLKIVFIDAESTDDELKSDTLTMLRSIGNKDIAIENFIPVVDAQIDGEALNLTNKKHFNQVKRFLAYHRPDIAILDTISALFTLYSENDNAEVVRKVIRPLKELAIAGNCAIWASHHIGKSGESDQAEGAYRGRGASAFGANVRGVITLRKEQALGPGYVKLEIAKAKGIRLDPTVLKLDFGRRTFEICQAKPEALMPYQTVLGKFNGQPLKTKEIKDLFPGMSGRTIDDILSLAVKNGDLTKPKNGVYQKPEDPTSQTSQPLIESAKFAKSTQPIEDEELTLRKLDWGENEACELFEDDFDPTLEALDR